MSRPICNLFNRHNKIIKTIVTKIIDLPGIPSPKLFWYQLGFRFAYLAVRNDARSFVSHNAETTSTANSRFNTDVCFL